MIDVVEIVKAGKRATVYDLLPYQVGSYVLKQRHIMCIRKDPQSSNDVEWQLLRGSERRVVKSTFVNPHSEELEDLSIFGREFDVVIASFDEATVESGVKVSRVEAKNAFEDRERSHVTAGANFDLDEGVEHVAKSVSMSMRADWNMGYSRCWEIIRRGRRRHRSGAQCNSGCK